MYYTGVCCMFVLNIYLGSIATFQIKTSSLPSLKNCRGIWPVVHSKSGKLCVEIWIVNNLFTIYGVAPGKLPVGKFCVCCCWNIFHFTHYPDKIWALYYPKFAEIGLRYRLCTFWKDFLSINTQNCNLNLHFKVFQITFSLHFNVAPQCCFFFLIPLIKISIIMCLSIIQWPFFNLIFVFFRWLNISENT